VEKLKDCLKSGKAKCSGVSEKEVTHVKSWHAFSKDAAEGKAAMPATAKLVALHNMITESVETNFIPADRKHFYCPASVLKELKSSILGGDEQVASYSLPPFASVPGVPGLAANHNSVSCPQ